MASSNTPTPSKTAPNLEVDTTSLSRSPPSLSSPFTPSSARPGPALARPIAKRARARLSGAASTAAMVAVAGAVGRSGGRRRLSGEDEGRREALALLRRNRATVARLEAENAELRGEWRALKAKIESLEPGAAACFGKEFDGDAGMAKRASKE
mmetsp:Transcript_1682/g.4519  ORF Transcript_1682/g.4519 Transcript_1682/m.4519 type:complete len:153 (-) Transcript_1682:112-570(-)|eukprot:CAMPEP_0174905964 /NCGR_PEP_ID=MMETSP0167-20121228/54999_1 /TAXON_ID=38298 /ORGANISM="Rhodella maculata, Strain CCMP736" /LENGTH=152 /DNA_ID=CAMNT_0016149075 /DNA_START=157 /DNA_END=615 /DNA_ORIENTATION=-